MAEKEESPEAVYAIVGKLVLVATALDYQLAEIMVEALLMGPSPMIMPVILTLDVARKVEILKRRAGLITSEDWRKGLLSHVEKVERVFRSRNIACHTPPVWENDHWTLKPLAAAKLFKGIDLDTKTLEGFKIADLAGAIALGETTLAQGAKVLDNFKRASAELEKRRGS